MWPLAAWGYFFDSYLLKRRSVYVYICNKTSKLHQRKEQEKTTNQSAFNQALIRKEEWSWQIWTQSPHWHDGSRRHKTFSGASVPSSIRDSRPKTTFFGSIRSSRTSRESASPFTTTITRCVRRWCAEATLQSTTWPNGRTRSNADQIFKLCVEPELQNFILERFHWFGCLSEKDCQIMGITIPKGTRINGKKRKDQPNQDWERRDSLSVLIFFVEHHRKSKDVTGFIYWWPPHRNDSILWLYVSFKATEVAQRAIKSCHEHLIRGRIT